MAEIVCRRAAGLRPGCVRLGGRQGNGLSRQNGIDIGQARVGDDGDALCRQNLLFLGERIADSGKRTAAAGKAQGDGRGEARAEKAAANSPSSTPAQFRATLRFANYFAVVLSDCGVPTMRASIMSARSRKFGGVSSSPISALNCLSASRILFSR